MRKTINRVESIVTTLFIPLVLSGSLFLSPASGQSKLDTIKGPLPKEDNTISPNECRNGVLEDTDQTFNSDGTYYDRYTLAWPGGDLQISLESNDFDAFLIVTLAPGDPDGTVVNIDDFFNDPETYNLQDAPVGTYTIWANSAEVSFGNYQVCVNQAAPCESPSAPGLSSPPDQAADQPLNLSLSWSTKAFPKVIYGDDDRTDLYEVADQNLLKIAESTVMLVPMSRISNNGNGTYTLDNATFNDYIQDQFGRPLCPSEPFADQPNPGDCSGFLVGPDLVVTAGHCVENGVQCADYAFVFGFQMIDATTPKLVIPEEDVYFCGSLVGQVLTTVTDWSIIRLDREVVNRTPLDIRRDGEISVGADLVFIGNPVGLPTKVASGAKVRENIPGNDFFVANLDSFEGNSGAVVINALTLTVEGALIRGESDFIQTGDCMASMHCGDNECRGEDVMKTTVFADLIPPIVSYEVRFGTCGNLQTLGSTDGTNWDLDPLNPNTTYCWQIAANSFCGSAESPVFSFTTLGVTETPTTTPTETPTESEATPVLTALNPNADINGDRVINEKDLLEVLQNWFRVSPK